MAQPGEAPAIHDLPIPASRRVPHTREVCGGQSDQLQTPRQTGRKLNISVHHGRRLLGYRRTRSVQRTRSPHRRPYIWHGAYAEYMAVAPDVKTEPLACIPDDVPDEQAAALPIPAITALGSLDLWASPRANTLL